MILFCVSCALIKLLIDQPGSAQMHQASNDADATAVCRITWAEAMAGMAPRQRDDQISSDAIEQDPLRLIQTWDQFVLEEVRQR